jgi:hypothetical protein
MIRGCSELTGEDICAALHYASAAIEHTDMDIYTFVRNIEF